MTLDIRGRSGTLSRSVCRNRSIRQNRCGRRGSKRSQDRCSGRRDSDCRWRPRSDGSLDRWQRGSARACRVPRDSARRPQGRGHESVSEGDPVSDFPSSARCVIIGAGIVGNCLVGPPVRPRLDRHGPARQGTAAQPRRLDRPRLELHLPDRSQQGDGVPHAREPAPIRGTGAEQHLRRHRGRPHARSGSRS